jgi:acetyl-CoA acyltransferase
MSGKRTAIVAGLRTPFQKQATGFRELSALELGTLVVRELIERSEIPKAELDAVVFGQVIPSLVGPNVAREIVLRTSLPRSVDAFSVVRACATSTQSAASASALIQSGQAKVVIAGGVDSTSDVPITVSKGLNEALIQAALAKSPVDKLKAFSHVAPKDLLPNAPALVELSTGLSMGEAAEKMAKENHISREAQDQLAHDSHTKAARGFGDGLLSEERMTVYAAGADAPVSEDNLIRKDSTLEGYARLRPVFDKRYGTITAGNASPLTDGAAALLLVREDVAKSLGLPIKAFIRSVAFAALDPSEQLLMGPAYATPKALDAANLKLSDLSVIDMHEAFAAQVLSNTQAFESKSWAEEKLGRSSAIGEIDWGNFNVYGGSIAIGHPFAATGARQILTVANELARRGGGFGLVTQCAAGGLGAAMILEANT